jgi:hypothetical protein
MRSFSSRSDKRSVLEMREERHLAMPVTPFI